MQRQQGDSRRGGDRDGDPTAVTFSTVEDGTGLALFDPIERHRCELLTPEAVSPEPVGDDRFLFPVGGAVAVETSAIELPRVVGTYVRDADGDTVATAEHFAHEELPADSYSVELTTAVKTYLRVDGAVTVSADLERTRIEFDGPTRVLVGARSRHSRPAATITTTADPEDVMTAVSHLGSALKTTSVERSYPTLRGHPPTIELGDELHVPDGVEAPDTGVRIEIPPEYRSAFVVAPLAYYLGAEVVPGERPRLVTDDGFEHPLDTHRGFEGEVERVLKQTFFMDCLVRTDGLYEFDLHERAAVESRVDLDLGALYDATLAEQLEAYLGVDYGVVEPDVPDWKLTTHVTPTPDSVELLPFLVDDLAVVRSPRAEQVAGSTDQLAAVTDFLRDDETFTRSAADTPAPDGPATLRPEDTDSLEQAWIGSGAPVGASQPTVESFMNRLDRTPADGDIDITVVCNDEEMVAEHDAVEAVYGSRGDLPFDVRLVEGLTTAELREVLAADTDFLHYIGHIDAEGFQCPDGRLDATTLDEVGVDAFFLNACSSYEQGLALIENGAIGGVVTLRDVINSGAVKIGQALSRLLDRGFPLRAALDIASDETVIGSQYLVVGDGGLAIAQAESGTPIVCDLRRAGDCWELSLVSYPTSERGIGSVTMPHLGEDASYYLSSGELESFELTQAELESYLSMEEAPVRFRGDLHWSGDLDFDSPDLTDR